MILKDKSLENFLEKYENKVSKKIKYNQIKATILQENLKDLELAAKRIQEGKLVSFQTETVYGLGANALDEEAVKSIFIAKGFLLKLF